MADVAPANFLHAYGEILVAAWSNEAVKNKFLKDPATVLKAYGLDPEGAKVHIIKPGSANVPPEKCTPESQIKLWNEGKKTGTIEFVFPDKPPDEFSSAELTDQQLMAIAGGVGNVCCCCCPCCCC